MPDNIETYTDKKRTVCEVIRETYDMTYAVQDITIKDEIRERLKIIYIMAKKMDKKLHEYKYNWSEGFWELNEDYEKDLERRSGRNAKT